MAVYPGFKVTSAVVKSTGTCHVTVQTSVPCQKGPIERVGANQRGRDESEDAVKERTTYVALAAMRMEADSVIARCKRTQGHQH